LASGSFPAYRHNQGANIAFADGNVIRHKWLWPNRKWTPNADHEVIAEAGLDTQDLIYKLMLCPVQP